MTRWPVATLLATIYIWPWVQAALPAAGNASWLGSDSCAELIAKAAISSCGASQQDLLGTVSGGIYQCRSFVSDSSTDAAPAAPAAALRVLLPDAFAGWLTPTLERFSAAYGTALELDVRPVSQLPAIVGAAARRPGQAPTHDVFLHTSDLTLTLADAGLLTDLSALLEVLDGGVEWLGVSQTFRLQVATYHGSILAMPLDGTSLVTMYRRSVLDGLGMQAPQTWREMLAYIRTYAAAVERYRLSGREGQLPPYAFCLPRGTTCAHQSYFQAVWSSIAQTHGVTQGVHFDTATLTPLINSVGGLEAFRIFAEMKMSAAPEEPDEPCARGSLTFARGRCALTLGSYVSQVRIVLDLAANATVALSDIGVARLPGSDVVWDRGGKQNGGTGGSVGGALMPCDTTLCPYSAVANVLPAPAYYGGDGSGSGEGNANSSSIGAWCAQASLTGGPTKEPRRVNYSPQSPASLLMGSVNKRSDVLAQLLGYELLLYLASPSRYLDTVTGGEAASAAVPAAASGAAGGSTSRSGTSITAAVSPLRVVEPVRPALLSAASSSAVWRAAGHENDLLERALPVLEDANQHPNNAWGLRMANGAYYLQLLEDIILGIEQGLVVRDGMSVAALDGLEERMNSIEASPAAAAPAVGTKQQRRGRSLAGLLPDSTSAAKPMGLQAALTRAAALASAYYPPEVYRGKYLASLVTHGTDHQHDMDSAAGSQSGGGGTGTGVLVGAVLGSVGGVALLLSIVVALVVFGTHGGGVHAAMHRRLPWLMMALGLRRRRFQPHNYELSAHAQVKAPGISSRSALLVTDIEDSTRLWEELAADVMSRALQLHHACIRHLVIEHHGYESATEGDSFILAFQTVKHAVAFAIELQNQLLVLPWPQELLTDKICMPVYTDLPEGFPFTNHDEPEDMEAAATPHGQSGASSPFVSAPGLARYALAGEGQRRRRSGGDAAAVDVMDLTLSAARLHGFTQNGYHTSAPPTPTAMSMSAAAQMMGRPQPSLAALEHICSMRRSQAGRRRSSCTGGGRSMSAAVLPGRLHALRSSDASATAPESGGSSGYAGGGTPRSKAAAILASAAATARAAASAAADRMGWRGRTRGSSAGDLRTPLGRGSVPSGMERDAASRAAIAVATSAFGDLYDGEEAAGVEEAGSALPWDTHERSTTACVMQRERDSCMQLHRPPQLLIPMSVGGEEEFSSCSWFSSSGGGSGGEDGERGRGDGGTDGGESCDRSDLPDGATLSALTSGNYEVLSGTMSPEPSHDPGQAGRSHTHRRGHAAEQREAAGPDAHDHPHQQQELHHRHHRRSSSRHSNAKEADHGYAGVREPRDRNSVMAALPPVLPWFPSGSQGYVSDTAAALTEVTAEDLGSAGVNAVSKAVGAGTASFSLRAAADTMDEDEMAGATADAAPSGAGARNLPSAAHSGNEAAVHRPLTLLLPQASGLEDGAGCDACGSRGSRPGMHASPSMGALLRTAAGIATPPPSARGRSRRPTAGGGGCSQVSDFATGSSVAVTQEVAEAAAAMEVLEAVMPPPLWTLPPQGRTLGQLLSELPPASCFTAAMAVGRTRRVLMFRGLRVRVGIHTGVNNAAEMQYNAASARIVYGGPCVAMCKAIADYANGGQIFLSAAAKEQLDEVVRHHNGGKPPGVLMLRLGAYVKEAAAAPAVPPPSASAGLLGQCTPRRILSRLPPSSNNITALAGGGYAVGGIGGGSMLLNRAQTTGAGSAAAAMLAAAEDLSASASVSRQTTRADGGGVSALAGPASAVRQSSGRPSAAPGSLTSTQLAAADRGPMTIPSNLMLPASTCEIGAQPQQQQQQQPARGNVPKARSLMQLQQQAVPVSSGSRRRVLAGDSGVVAGQSISPPRETAVYWLTSSSLSQRLALVSRPRVPKDHVPLEDVYNAPVGRLTYVVLQVPAATALLAWDAEVAGAALRLLQDTARRTMRKYTCGAYLTCSQPGELTAAFGSSAAAVRWAEGLRKELLNAPWSEALLAHELCEVVEVPESDSSIACSDFFLEEEEEEESTAVGDTDLDAQLGGPNSIAHGRLGSASDMQSRVSISSASAGGVMGHLMAGRHQHRSREAADDRGASSSRGRGATVQGIRGDATLASTAAAGGLAAWIGSRLDKAVGVAAGASTPGSPLPLGISPLRRHATSAGTFTPAAAVGTTASPPSTPAPADTSPFTAAALVAAATFGSIMISGAATSGGASAPGLPPTAQELSASATLMGPFTHVPSRLGLMHRPGTMSPALSPLPKPPAAVGSAATPAISGTGGSASVSTTGLLLPQSACVPPGEDTPAASSRISHPPCSGHSPRGCMGASPCSGDALLLHPPGASPAPDAASGVGIAGKAADAGALMQPIADCIPPSVGIGLSAPGCVPGERLHEAFTHRHSAASITTTAFESTASPRCSPQLTAPDTTAITSTATTMHLLLMSGYTSVPGVHTNASTSPMMKPEGLAGGGRIGPTAMVAAVANDMEARRAQAHGGGGDGTGAAAAGQAGSTCGRNSPFSALNSLQAADLRASPLEPTSTDEPATAAESSISGEATSPRGFSARSEPGGRALGSVPAALRLALEPQHSPGQRELQPHALLQPTLARPQPAAFQAAVPQTVACQVPAAPATVRTEPGFQLSSARTDGCRSLFKGSPSQCRDQQPQSPCSPASPSAPQGGAAVQPLPQSQPQCERNARLPAPLYQHPRRLGHSSSLEAELRKGGAAGSYSMPGGAYQGTASGCGTNAHGRKGKDALESIAEPMPTCALDVAAASADASTPNTVPGLAPASSRPAPVPEGPPVYSHQMLEEILPQRPELRSMPQEWQSEPQNAVEGHPAGTRCNDTVVGTDGRVRHLLLRGLRIRVGIATGRPTWSAADHSHELAYSGKPVRLAQRLAGAVAACGQVVVCCAVTCQEALAAQQHELLQQQQKQQLAAVAAQRGSNGAGAGNRATAGPSLSAQPSSIAEEVPEREAASGAAGVHAADGGTAPAAAGDSASMLMAFMPVMEGNTPAYLGGRVRDKRKRWKQVVFVVSLFPPDAPPPSLAAVAAINRPRLPSGALTPTARPAGQRHAVWLMPMSRSSATATATPRGAAGSISGFGLLSNMPGAATRSHASMPLLKLAGAARSSIAAVAAVATAAGLRHPGWVTPPRTRLTSAAGSFVGRINTGSSLLQGGGGYGGSMPLAQVNTQAVRDRSPEKGAADVGVEAERAPDNDGIVIGGAGGEGDVEGDGDGAAGPSHSGHSDQQSRAAAWRHTSLPAAAFGASIAGASNLPARATSSNVGSWRPASPASWPHQAQAVAAVPVMPPAPVAAGVACGERRRTYPAMSFRGSDTGSCAAASQAAGAVFGGAASGTVQPDTAAAVGPQGRLPPCLALGVPPVHGASKPAPRLRQPATYSGEGSGRDGSVDPAATLHFNNRGSISTAGAMAAVTRNVEAMGSGYTSTSATVEVWRHRAPIAGEYTGLQQPQQQQQLDLLAADAHCADMSRGPAASASIGPGLRGFAGRNLRAAPLLGLQVDAVTEEHTADLSGACVTTGSGPLGRGSSPGALLSAVGPLEVMPAEGEREGVSMLITPSARSVRERAAAAAAPGTAVENTEDGDVKLT